MRDIVLTVVIFGTLPFILWRPYIGILVWTWLGFMNPHRLTWGFAYDLPFALIVALTTLLALLLTKEPKKVPWTVETKLLAMFVAWMFITTLNAVFFDPAWEHFSKVIKIQIMIFATLILMQSKERIQLLVWVMTASLAFYGVKGGIFTILTGGAYHVRGPDGSFIGGDNEIGLALIMTVPLLRYVQLTSSNRILRLAMTPAIALTAIAIAGSQSRGAFLGLVCMGAFLWVKSRNKFFTGILAVVGAVLVLSVMPQQWYDRMATIKTYEADESAMGRINAWKMGFNMAKDRPLGGGFDSFRGEMFALYAPNPDDAHDAHSIYFEVLGEHGFVGLALFLALATATWLSASWVIKQGRRNPDDRWAADLASMVQVSLVGYATAGAFLGLAYFDFYYTLVAVIVLCKTVLIKNAAMRATATVSPLSTLPIGAPVRQPRQLGTASGTLQGRG